MSMNIRIALIGAFVLGLASAASAQPGFDNNLANRYPHYADPGVYGYTGTGNAPALLQSEQPAALGSWTRPRGRVRHGRATLRHR